VIAFYDTESITTVKSCIVQAPVLSSDVFLLKCAFTRILNILKVNSREQTLLVQRYDRKLRPLFTDKIGQV
jgi:hypothetical protein